jgi:hypothetical protein
VRPGKNDHKHGVRIIGAELRELKLIDLPESFGLDRRIERYEGKRPMGLYRADLDGLLAAHARWRVWCGSSPFPG